MLVHIDRREKGAVVKSGEGLVPMTDSWEELFEWCKDGQAERLPTVLLFDLSGYGDLADEARKAGLLVVGGSKFCDRAEKDRDFGFSLAEQMGALLPNYETFSRITDAIKYAERLGDQPTYFKTDRFIDYNSTYGAQDSYEMVEFLTSLRERVGDRVKCIIQDSIEGTAISTAQWFNGKEFTGPVQGLIEHKKLLNDDIGPKTGCAVNAVWFYQDETSFIGEALNWGGLAGVLRKYDAPPGMYDANAIVTPDGEAYFLEWCARLGYDSEPTAQLLIDDFSQFLWHVASGQGSPGRLSKNLAYATRVWVPPYPTEYNSDIVDEKHSVVGHPIFGISTTWGSPFAGYGIRYRNGKYELATSAGEVGMIMHSGRYLSTLNKACVDFGKTLRPAGFCYRTDGDKVIKADAEKIMRTAKDLHEGLVK